MNRIPREAAEGLLTSRPAPDAPLGLPPGVHPVDVPGARQGLLVVPSGPLRPLPLLVFFHGAGGSASRSLPAVQDAADAAGVLALLPSSAGPTWDLLTGGLGPDVAALDGALGGVFARQQVTRVAFGGFSDGASYALSLGLANGDLAEALLAFSPGFAAPPAQRGTPRVWVSHGTGDTVLPVDRCGRRVVRLLGDAGYEVHYEEFVGAHVVPPGFVADALRWWLDA
ncbi:MAG: phospholipase [Actinomycetota bacterium]|jgi:phospholipase/carboxylesterase|nr:phospholipase [Actinomycetota bacterium]